jgi:hypothetical protein
MSNNILNNPRTYPHVTDVNKVRNLHNREKVSTDHTYREYNVNYDKNPLRLLEQLDGTATSVYNSNGYVDMKGIAQNDRVLRQSRFYHTINHGRHITYDFAAAFNVDNINGIISRIGAFDSHDDKTVDSGGNGLFFEFNTGVFYVVSRFGSSSNTDTKIAQSNFNYDKLDGFGPSGKKIVAADFAKIYSFSIEFRFIGVSGVVRFFIYFGGAKFLLHQMEFDGITTPGIKTSNLPIRFEVTKTENNADVAHMIQSNAIVTSEGKHIGQIIRATAGQTSLLSKAVNTSSWIPLISVRLRNEFNRSTFYPFRLTLYNQANNNEIGIAIFVNPVYTNLQPVWNANFFGLSEYDTTADAISINPFNFYAEVRYTEGRSNLNLHDDLISLPHNDITTSGSTIEGVQDVACVCITSFGSPVTVNFTFQWIDMY